MVTELRCKFQSRRTTAYDDHVMAGVIARTG